MKQHGSATYERLNVGELPFIETIRQQGVKLRQQLPFTSSPFQKRFCFYSYWSNICHYLWYYYPAKIQKLYEKCSF